MTKKSYALIPFGILFILSLINLYAASKESGISGAESADAGEIPDPPEEQAQFVGR
ncbi:MAG: hypothetical protein SOZ59_00175 [Candidatus Limivivens sp.]|nr:hypothetical protein [Candidatus Limivivens sp.]